MCTPTQAAACLRERDLIRALDFSALRSFRVAGGPSSGTLLTRLADAFAGVEIINVYATTECAPCFGQRLDGPRQPLESCGRPLPGVDARIVDDSGRESDRGELWLRSDLIGVGTILDEATIRDHVDDDGWYGTGDVFRRDPDGWCYFVGRKDDMFVCGGENVHPTEIERILSSSPHVSEACVVALPDDILGAVPAAAAVLSPKSTADAAQLAAHVADNAAPHLVPHRIQIVAEIPSLGPGKFDRARVRADLLGEQPPGDEPREQPGPMLKPEFEAIAAAWSEVLGLERVDPDVEFLAAGGDSLKAVRLVTRLNSLELPITVVDLFERGTVRRLTEHVMAQRSAAGAPGDSGFSPGDAAPAESAGGRH
jgi:long-chain acyl-CoA synthetase